MFNLHDSDESF